MRVEQSAMGTAIILATIGLAFVALAAVGSAMRTRSARRRAYVEAVDRFIRGETWEQGSVTSSGDVDPATWYLAGVQALRAGRVRDAARAFGIAHHADFELVSAALLTFAGLKASSGAVADVVQSIVATWREMKRPTLGETQADGLMLGAIARTAPAGPPNGSKLATLIWGVTDDAHRARLRDLIESGPEWARDLRA
ncbi:MAG: hypothetical protein HZA51_16270 [Planctomycetes bacterium]|nr:hypothetical protein [Planctomycetota bacterium]